MKLRTIALASAFALSSGLALAQSGGSGSGGGWGMVRLEVLLAVRQAPREWQNRSSQALIKGETSHNGGVL